MRRRFDCGAEQNERQTGEAVIGLSGLFVSKAQEQRQIGNGTLLQLGFVELEKMSEVATRRTCLLEGARVDVLQTEFGNGFGEGASKAGRLGDGGEIGQAVGGCGGVYNSRGKRFDAEAGNGSECETPKGLSSKMRGELGESECVNTLASRWESAGRKFFGGASGRRDQDNVRVLGLLGEERGGVVEECGVGAGMNERTVGHRQL